MTDTLEYAVLSPCPKSKDQVSADLMCKIALSTKLEIFSSAEFEACSKPSKPGTYVVPIQDEKAPLQLKLLQVINTGSWTRDTEAPTSAGWPVPYRWLFKRRPYAP
jgi:hypothetical protein